MLALRIRGEWSVFARAGRSIYTATRASRYEALTAVAGMLARHTEGTP